MGFLWLENRRLKGMETSQNYEPLGWDENMQFAGYQITQHNVSLNFLLLTFFTVLLLSTYFHILK